MQIMQAPGIRSLLADRLGRAFLPVLTIPGVPAELTFVITKAPSGIAPRPTGILPLRFGQQPVVLPSLLAQPLAVRLGIIPGNIDHRPTPPTPALVIRFFSAGGVTEGVVLLEGNRIFANGKVAEGDRMG